MLIHISAPIAMGFSPLVRGIELRATNADAGAYSAPRGHFVIYLAIIGGGVVLGLMVIPPLVGQARELWAQLSTSSRTFSDSSSVIG